MSQHKSLVAINLSVFLLMIGVGLIVAILPRRIMDLSASIADVGLLASAYAIPNLLLQIPVGKLADRFGFKGFIVGGYLLCGLSGLLYYFADTPFLFFGGRFFQGIAEVPIWALAPALLSIRYVSVKGAVMGAYNASLHCGLTLGGLLSMVVGRFWQGNEPFLLFTAMSTLGGVITVLWAEDPQRQTVNPTPSRRVGGKSLARVVNRMNLVVLAGTILYGAGYGIFITIVPAFLIDTHAAAPCAIGLYFTLFYLAVSLSQLLAGRWSDRWGRKPVMVIGLALAASGIAMFQRCPFSAAITVLALASLGLGMFCVSAMAFLNERVGETQKGGISGIFYFCWGGGYFLGPLLLGHSGASMGLTTGFGLFAGLIMAQLVAIIVTINQQRFALIPFGLPPERKNGIHDERP
ncbi:MFS transporter [Desulfosarcina ovata subsp. sediminis]|uniref:MFS transporter n=1 Tax=Desulfosarcina ovata subsp. sediminis TaxID=885957 RepID=A0A5K7ZS14_9BACT|nr:MFS transporter [Desulfosarcina ovata]BBO82994.1 MFS transporter [Desulfosarcina ovata subsp. sediminis]